MKPVRKIDNTSKERIKYILIGFIIGVIIGMVTICLLMRFGIIRPFGSGAFSNGAFRNISGPFQGVPPR